MAYRRNRVGGCLINGGWRKLDMKEMKARKYRRREIAGNA